MARLPTPGGDAGNWGEILNDYLRQEHNTDGTLKKAAEIAAKANAADVYTKTEVDTTLSGKASTTITNDLRTDVDAVTPTSQGHTIVRGPNGPVSVPGVLNVRAYGAIGNGVADDTAAFQAAVSALGTSGGVIVVPKGTYRITSTVALPVKSITIRGDGFYNTRIVYTASTGALFRIGSFDASGSDYLTGGDTVTSPQNLAIESTWLEGTYDATAANPTGTPYGIIDYEAGGWRLHDVRFNKFYRGFWGIASDLNHFQDVVVTRCDIGFDLRDRSDQQTFFNCYGFGNRIMIRLSGVVNADIIRCAFVDNIGPDLVLTGAVADADPLGGGTYTNVRDTACMGITIDTPWFELYRNKHTGNTPWPAGQPTKSCYVSIGIDDTLNTRPVRNIRLINPKVGATETAPATADAFVRTGFADGVDVDPPVYFTGGMALPVMRTNTAASVDSGGQLMHAGRVSVGQVRRHERYNSVNTPLIVGDAISPLANIPPPGQRRGIVANPTFDRAGFGWTKTGGATLTAYTLTGSESALGDPQTLAVTAQFGSIRQAVRLRPTTAYEVIIRYKTSGDSARWQLAITPSTVAPASNLWQRQLDPQATFAEVRFLIPSYNLVLSGPLVLLRYLGTTFTDTITIDYLDVQEVTPVEHALVRGQRREFWQSGTAAPTTGTWEVGDVIHNSTPAAGGFMGIVCVTAGTPGTWRTFGPVSV